MGGAGLGFGGGFAEGFMRAMAENRQRKWQEERLADEQKWREFSTFFPQVVEQGLASGDVAGVNSFVGRYYPELAKRFEKEGSPFDKLQPLMMQTRQRPAVGQEQMLPGAPTSIEVPKPQRQKLLGVEVLTPDERTQKALDDLIATTKAQARGKAMGDFEATAEVLGPMMERIQNDVYPTLKTLDPNATVEDAFAVFGIRMPSQANRLGGPMYAGSWQDYVAGKVAEAQARGETPSPDQRAKWRQEFERMTANRFYGQDREAITKSLFPDAQGFDSLDAARAGIVIREEQRMLRGESSARALGTAEGRFQGPTDLKDAQSTGVPVGTSAADVAGQTVPTMAQQDRRRSVEDVRASLKEILDGYTDPDTGETIALLDVLPKEGELGSLLPGVAYAMRRRNPAYREKIARLESRINNIVNVMARSVGEQRGTQTERDALRAEAAIAQIRDAFATGDTRESAKARIEESLRVLDQILQSLPTQPVPRERQNGAAGAAPAASGAGVPLPEGFELGPDGRVYIKKQKQ